MDKERKSELRAAEKAQPQLWPQAKEGAGAGAGNGGGGGAGRAGGGGAGETGTWRDKPGGSPPAVVAKTGTQTQTQTQTSAGAAATATATATAKALRVTAAASRKGNSAQQRAQQRGGVKAVPFTLLLIANGAALLLMMYGARQWSANGCSGKDSGGAGAVQPYEAVNLADGGDGYEEGDEDGEDLDPSSGQGGSGASFPVESGQRPGAVAAAASKAVSFAAGTRAYIPKRRQS